MSSSPIKAQASLPEVKSTPQRRDSRSSSPRRSGSSAASSDLSVGNSVGESKQKSVVGLDSDSERESLPGRQQEPEPQLELEPESDPESATVHEPEQDLESDSEAEPEPQPEYPSTQHQQRKRPSEAASKIEFERSSKRIRLTKEALGSLERMAGRGKKSAPSAPSVSATSVPSDASSDSKKTVSTTGPNFRNLALENEIMDPSSSEAPENYDDLCERIDRKRNSPSPTLVQYQHFREAVQRAPNEMSILIQLDRIMTKHDTRHYHVRHNQPFSNIPKNAGFNNGLSSAQPDIVEGLDAPAFSPFPVVEKLGGMTSDIDGTVLPHLAGELKGPGKSLIVAETQAAYDGACMVFSRDRARQYLGKPDPQGHAFISTFATDGKTLETFAHHSTESNGKRKYHQFATSGTVLNRYDDFKKGCRRIRNVQDYAKEQVEILRDELTTDWTAKCESEEEDEDTKLAQIPVAQTDEETGEPTLQPIEESYAHIAAVKQDEDDIKSFVQITSTETLSVVEQPLSKSPFLDDVSTKDDLGVVTI